MIPRGPYQDAGRAAATAYQRSHVMSSTPAQLVVLLYERLLADLQGAALAIRAGDIKAKSARVQRATDVIFELLASLDRAAGGEVSDRLASLYTYMISRLGEVSRSKNPAVLDELAGHAEALLSAWRAVAEEPTEDPEAATAVRSL
jgi:flagellar protein FliS